MWLTPAGQDWNSSYTEPLTYVVYNKNGLVQKLETPKSSGWAAFSQVKVPLCGRNLPLQKPRTKEGQFAPYPLVN